VSEVLLCALALGCGVLGWRLARPWKAPAEG
jgi:hypothetical protein